MRILIAGAGGLIGAALARHFREKAVTFPLLRHQLDVSDVQQVRATVSQIAPDLVINATAIGVDECEGDPQRARVMNVEGPAGLAREASRIGAAFIHFSSNYVFRGERTDGGFYLPGDEAVPVNVYGRTKLEGERLVLSLAPRAWIIRTSWVFGSGKESFLATLPQKLRKGERVTAITDLFASVTFVEDLVRQLDELIAFEKFGVYHINNSGVCSYAEFADATSRLLGLTEAQRIERIDYETADRASRAAPRPRWTPMACDRSERIGLPPMRPWREALAEYVRRIGITTSQ
jgi:dTDP-4-dehydrorhamnose reductase